MEKTFAPLMEVARIQSEINRLFENLLDLGAGTGGVWIPNADIVETETTLVVEVELPGVRGEDLRLSVHSGQLEIAGERGRNDPDAMQFQAAERAFGTFRRVIHLGTPVNTRQARAVLNNGLLRICFPRVPNRRGEAVPIEVTTE